MRRNLLNERGCPLRSIVPELMRVSSPRTHQRFGRVESPRPRSPPPGIGLNAAERHHRQAVPRRVPDALPRRPASSARFASTLHRGSAVASRRGCLRSSLPSAGQHLDRDWTQTSLLVRSHEPLPASASSFALSGASSDATAATPTAVASEATGTEIAISVISACA